MTEVDTTHVRYSPREGILFWIPNQYLREDAHYAIDFINALLENIRAFASFAGIHEGSIRSLVIDQPSRYRHRRVYYVETACCPDSVKRLYSTSTMNHYIAGYEEPTTDADP